MVFGVEEFALELLTSNLVMGPLTLVGSALWPPLPYLVYMFIWFVVGLSMPMEKLCSALSFLFGPYEKLERFSLVVGEHSPR